MKGLDRARLAALGLIVALPGCGEAFSMAAPSTFRAPATSFARVLKASATEPALREVIAAESLRDVRPMGTRALLDFRGEDGGSGAFGTGSFGAYPICGPLEMRELRGGRRVWSVQRAPGCDDEIISVNPRLVVLGLRGDGEAARFQLATLDTATGKTVASVAAERPAQATASGEALVLVQGKAGGRRASLHEGDQLSRKWEAKLGDEAQLSAKVVTVGESVIVLGSKVTVIARGSGQVVKSIDFGAGSLTLDALPTGDAVYALGANEKAKTARLSRITSDGKLAWTNTTARGALDVVTSAGPLLVDGAAVTALKAADGSPAWTAKLPAAASGAGLVVGSRVLFPHSEGVTALDVATGALAYTVAPFAKDPKDAQSLAIADRLALAGDGLVVLDTAKGVAGIEVSDTKGNARWAIRVRSLPHVTRQGRLLSAFGKFDDSVAGAMLMRIRQNQAATTELFTTMNNMGGGGLTTGALEATMQMQSAGQAASAGNWGMFVEALNFRKREQVRASLAQARIDDGSNMILRPISWATGRGVLVVRKSDGAFREIVTGPPDVYEDAFRQASVAAYLPLAQTVVTFSEGLDASKWVDGKEQRAVQLVNRGLVAYGLDEASLHPAAEYAKRSVVPLGSFEGTTGPTMAPVPQ
ncbi:MAG: PQQ-binding-like beta-propeller repeat protein [Myxococcales bacterium]|nr:PQQ-binding-like beta-propeller repeat protein [Myxococcales bacterium]